MHDTHSPVLRQIHGIPGMRIHATDGDAGHVHDLYFDDRDWCVRYLHVDTHPGFLGRHVLLAPTVIRSVDWDHGRIHVALTREQVRNSADIDSHRPVSRQHDTPLSEYVAWPFASSESLWEGEQLAVRLQDVLIEMGARQAVAPAPPTAEDPHLWSIRAVRRYHVEGDHGDLGNVDDFMVDPDAWKLHYLVVDNGGPFHANRFLVPIETVRWISWNDKRLRVALGEAGGDDRSNGT
jgi:uncharacterized protein YrrD